MGNRNDETQGFITEQPVERAVLAGVHLPLAWSGGLGGDADLPELGRILEVGETFGEIECESSGDWGWRARVELAGKAKAEIELITNRDAHHYVARTFAGAGTPSEIWTSLDPIAEDRTAIAVE